MSAHGISTSERSAAEIEGIERSVRYPLCVAVDGELAGILAYSDPIRPEAPKVIEGLRRLGIGEVLIVTGDNPIVAQAVAKSLGIERWIAGALPRQKVEAVENLQREGYTVCVVGDGINDSPALSQADVGIAVTGGVDVAQETADIALLRGSLWKIPLTVDICRQGVSLIQQNWKIISIPNTLVIMLALTGLMGPSAATLISNGSAILATANGLRPLLDGSRGRNYRTLDARQQIG
jgi:Cu2+-exporting ATPase